jgi:hypothetical protein
MKNELYGVQAFFDNRLSTQHTFVMRVSPLQQQEKSFDKNLSGIFLLGCTGQHKD